ncbi:MAG: putative DNA binding domain-containing protein [Proteobacteria bacterium]|nr:putative DNA binding domain-containing protein [Pseudomonadota bacterium]
MASSATSNEFEQSLKFLTVLADSKRESLVAICHKTGLKLADIFRCADRLENAGIIAREKLNGNTFVVLKNHNYQAKLEQIYGVSVPKQDTAAAVQPTNVVSGDRREAILKRRQERVAKANQENEASKIEKKKPTPISAVDLLAIKRSAGTNKKIFPNPRTGKLAAPIGLVKKSEQDRKPAMSSNAYKSVNMSRNGNKGQFLSRSTYMSSMMGDSLNIERTDTNFKPLEDIERPSQGPIIPFKNTVRASNEILESDVRKKLNIADDKILIAFLMPKPNNEFWKACSALANSGGGVIILGMKKYGTDGDASFFVKSIARPEEIKKNLLTAFNDRKNISDCPKNLGFIETVEFQKNKVIAVRINPEDLSSAPLFVDKNSFSTSDCAGCFVYRNGNVEHCTEEEVKQLWDLRRVKGADLDDEEIDWDQSDEPLQIDMERKTKPDVPTGFNESIMPLSQQKCAFGEKLPPILPPSLTKKYPGKLPPERTPENFSALIHAFQCAEPKNEEEKKFFEEQVQLLSEIAVADKIAKAEAASKKEEKKTDTRVPKPYPTQPKMINPDSKTAKINAANANALRLANAAFQSVSTIPSKTKLEKMRREQLAAEKQSLEASADGSRKQIDDELKRIESKLAEAKASAKARTSPTKEAEKVDIKAQLEAAARAELEDELNVLRASSTTNPRIPARKPVFASDTAARSTQPKQPAETVQTAPMPVQPKAADAMPPKLAEIGRAKLDEIALPVVEMPRLPQTRICEIVVELLKTARLKPTEVADILNKKLVLVRDKLIPKIRETHEITVVEGYYFIKE